MRVVSVVLAAATVAGSMAGCSSPGTAPASERSPSGGPVGAIDYWTKGRLLAATDWGRTTVLNPGPHGFSEILGHGLAGQRRDYRPVAGRIAERAYLAAGDARRRAVLAGR